MEPQHQIQKYTCPMHAHILLDAPGKCPLCGMALEGVIDMGSGSTRDKHIGHSAHGGTISDFKRRFYVVMY